MLCRYLRSFHAMQVPQAFTLCRYLQSFHAMQGIFEAFMLCRCPSFDAMQVPQAFTLCRCPKLSCYAGAPSFHAMQVPQAFMLCRCPKQEAAGTPTFAYWIKTWALTSDTSPCLSFCLAPLCSLLVCDVDSHLCSWLCVLHLERSHASRCSLLVLQHHPYCALT
jgi:hypothetical protein